MSWIVRFNAAHHFVEVVLNGVVTPKDLEESTAAGWALARAQGANRFLIVSQQVAEFSSLAAFYELAARSYREAGVDRRARAAVVPAQDDVSQKTAQFYEDACRNRGWNVRTFPDRPSALDWLCGTTKA